ncbi:MAG: hypothetical protein HC802_12730 [Caldilineaceae bacterium]|nr:hypothetical protein [Caldilineaceae bacterium]
MSDSDRFRVGISADFLVQAPGLLERAIDDHLAPLGYIDTDYFEPRGVDAAGAYVLPSDVADFDAVMVLSLRFPAASFDRLDRLALIARWGVGFDRIDIEAATQSNVLVSINVDAVRRPVAEAIVTLLLALAKRLPQKDRIVRTGRWQSRAEETLSLLYSKSVLFIYHNKTNSFKV